MVAAIFSINLPLQIDRITQGFIISIDIVGVAAATTGAWEHNGYAQKAIVENYFIDRTSLAKTDLSARLFVINY